MPISRHFITKNREATRWGSMGFSWHFATSLEKHRAVGEHGDFPQGEIMNLGFYSMRIIFPNPYSVTFRTKT